MFSLRRLIKNYDETGSLNEQLSPQSFIDEELFVTKAGDIGAVLEVRGVDFECLDSNSVDGFVWVSVMEPFRQVGRRPHS